MTPALADFAGEWTVTRRIEDRRAGREGTFSGRAVFLPDGDGLDYREEGSIAFPGQPPLRAERRYRWRAEGARIAVLYADGRPFHSFSQALPGAEHLCAPDLYQVRYAFEGWPVWECVWDVSGPRKDYRLHSVYRRQEG